MRAAALIALAIVSLAVVAIVALPAGGDYHVRIVLENGSQLVKGNRITVGGREVGLIDDIVLRDDNLAEVRATLRAGELLPLHEGTTATVRSPSLAGVANRYIALDPGPNSARALRSGSVIPLARTASPVEVDELLNSLDAQTRGALRGLVAGGAEQYRGVAAQGNAALARLNPALAELESTAHDAGAGSAQLERLLTEASAVLGAVADHRPALQQSIARTSELAGSLAGVRGDLDALLARAPAALRATTRTLGRAAATARAIRPAARDARRAAPAATALLGALTPAIHATAAATPGLRGLAADLWTPLRRMPALTRRGTPALRSSAKALRDAGPVVAAARAYTPDLIGGILGGLGGSTSGYYDANGHYLRLGINASLLSVVGLGSLLPLEAATDNPVARTRSGQLSRCPGAATQPAADRSNPWVTPEAPCDPEDSP